MKASCHRASEWFRRSVGIGIIAVFLACTGCATRPPLPIQDSQRSEFGIIALIPARYLPMSNFETFARDQISGTAKGAASGAFLGAVHGAAVGLATGPFAAFFVPFLASVEAVVGGVAGGVYGATTSIPEGTAVDVDTMIANALKEIDTQRSLAERVRTSGRQLADNEMALVLNQGPSATDEKPRYADLKKKFNTAIEIGVLEVGFNKESHGGSNPSLTFFMIARARCVRINESVEIYSRDFIYFSGSYTLSQWAENDAKRVQREFERSYERLAERMIQELFVLVDASRGDYKGCGLMPKAPKPEYNFFRACLDFTPIDTVQPVFEWEAFQGAVDPLTGIPRPVSYDLKIWKADEGYLGDVVYDREGLASCRHRIEIRLEPSTRYFWSVRARFKIDGRAKATDWAFSSVPGYHVSALGKVKGLAGTVEGVLAMRLPCTLDFIPQCNYYRFQTPSD